LNRATLNEGVSIFLSHSSPDKPFVRSLAHNLRDAGFAPWIDEAEIKLGDSLINKISEGIDRCDYLAVVLSASSCQSEWVNREVNIALTQEIRGKRVKVLPLILEECEIPPFLLDKKYVDFSGSYVDGINELLRNFGVQKNDPDDNFMRNFVFQGLLRQRNPSDVESIDWLPKRQFKIALDRMAVLGIGIYGTEAVDQDGVFVGVEVVEMHSGSTIYDYSWIKAFVDSFSDDGVQFSATYEVPLELLDAFSKY